jgi:hypothetical protein
VNRGTIDANRNRGEDAPPFTIRKGKHGKPRYASRVRLPAGAEMIYSAHDPILPCGARAVITCPTEPEVVS